MRLKLIVPAVAVLLASSICTAVRLAAQNPPEPSIADAARQNRAQKKSTPKTGTVITNDTLSPTPASSAPASRTATAAPQATAGPDQSAQPAAPAGTAASKPAAQPELSKEDAERLKAEIALIKQEFKDKQNEVDLLQRLLNLDREALNSKPDPSRDVEGKAKIDAEQDDLNQKSAEFEKLKAKLQSIAPELTTTAAPPKS
jgi:hypothetical protein